MDRAGPDLRVRTELAWAGRAALAMVFAIAALDWLGWATGIDALTRVLPQWPQMTPTTALLLALLAAGVSVQMGRPSPGRVWAGIGLAVVAGGLGAAFLTEYVTGKSFGLSHVLFRDAMRTLPSTFPGSRPSQQTVASVLALSLAVGTMRVDRRWTRVVWPLCLATAGAVPIVTAVAHLFGSDSPLQSQAIPAAVGLLLLVAATLLARPDRSPVAWLLARPDRWPLVRLVGIIAGFPVLEALLRSAFLAFGVDPKVERVLSTLVTTVAVGSVVFYFGQREQMLLHEQQRIAGQRTEAELRYRLLADNAVDIVSYVRGVEVVWISPSVEAAFGWPPEYWIGKDFSSRIHPDDLEAVLNSLGGVIDGDSAIARCRIHKVDGGYHWVEFRGKPYIDAEGNVDGVITAARIIDKQVEAERKLEQLARFDSLTGLVNRAETIARFESALRRPRMPGQYVGVLFCDIDHFKQINDTWGHTVGDVVLAKAAARIRECVREGDTVGRAGGDEILVLLPGLHNHDEATRIAEKIRRRLAEPIHHDGQTIHVTMSIGATLADASESVVEATARADEAMYQSKRSGRNAVTCI